MRIDFSVSTANAFSSVIVNRDCTMLDGRCTRREQLFFSKARRFDEASKVPWNLARIFLGFFRNHRTNITERKTTLSWNDPNMLAIAHSVDCA